MKISVSGNNCTLKLRDSDRSVIMSLKVGTVFKVTSTFFLITNYVRFCRLRFYYHGFCSRIFYILVDTSLVIDMLLT